MSTWAKLWLYARGLHMYIKTLHITPIVTSSIVKSCTGSKRTCKCMVAVLFLVQKDEIALKHIIKYCMASVMLLLVFVFTLHSGQMHFELWILSIWVISGVAWVPLAFLENYHLNVVFPCCAISWIFKALHVPLSWKLLSSWYTELYQECGGGLSLLKWWLDLARSPVLTLPLAFAFTPKDLRDKPQRSTTLISYWLIYFWPRSYFTNILLFCQNLNFDVHMVMWTVNSIWMFWTTSYVLDLLRLKVFHVNSSDDVSCAKEQALRADAWK